MNPKIRWLISIALLIFTVLLMSEGLQLWSYGSEVDGDGIGVYFFGLEINDRVLEANIPSYAIGFFFGGLCTLILAIIPIVKILLHSKSENAI